MGGATFSTHQKASPRDAADIVCLHLVFFLVTPHGIFFVGFHLASYYVQAWEWVVKRSMFGFVFRVLPIYACSTLLIFGVSACMCGLPRWAVGSVMMSSPVSLCSFAEAVMFL